MIYQVGTDPKSTKTSLRDSRCNSQPCCKVLCRRSFASDNWHQLTLEKPFALLFIDLPSAAASACERFHFRYLLLHLHGEKKEHDQLQYPECAFPLALFYLDDQKYFSRARAKYFPNLYHATVACVPSLFERILINDAGNQRRTQESI